MMPLFDFVNPVCSEEFKDFVTHSFFEKNVTFLQEESIAANKKYKVALLGLPDQMTSESFDAAMSVRKSLYSLTSLSGELDLLDVGNVKPGKSFIDTCYAICEVFTYFNKLDIALLLIGGTSLFNQGCILGYGRSNLPMNFIDVNASFQSVHLHPGDLCPEETRLLYNYTNLAYQSYLVERKTLDEADDLNQEAYRLGWVRSNLQETEPILRDASHISLSLNAVKYADAPASGLASPNGLNGDEFCQLSFFAGHAIRLKSIGIYDLIAKKDSKEITSMLAAQTAWYFLEGFSNAIYEEPDTTPEHFKTYIIHHDNTGTDISFHRSTLTSRWWMEIRSRAITSRTLLSCSAEDYRLACSQEIPERWWKTFHRLQL